VKYLHGLTQLRYVFVYPHEKDLVLGGPAEPWVAKETSVTGKRSGRPMLQLDDFVVEPKPCAIAAVTAAIAHAAASAPTNFLRNIGNLLALRFAEQRLELDPASILGAGGKTDVWAG